MGEDEELEGRITVVVNDEYELVGSAAPMFATEKLGIIEDLIEAGELMTPAVKPDDTVFFVYKNTVVLEGRLNSVFSDYDQQDGKYYYQEGAEDEALRQAE